MLDLSEAVERIHGAGNDLRRQADETQGLVIFLSRRQAPLDVLLERCQLLRVLILLVEQQPAIGYNRVRILPLWVGEEGPQVFGQSGVATPR